MLSLVSLNFSKLMYLQEALLSITNAFEGTSFVNQSITSTAADYALDLFPKFGQVEADTAGLLYSGLGTRLFQVDAVQGECACLASIIHSTQLDMIIFTAIFICPTYSLLKAFPGRSFKGEFAIPPGLHGQDIVYYFPGTATPPFDNTEFIDAFAQSFTSFVISLDPNIKVDTTTITPEWNVWAVGNTEMLFNRTDAGDPEVHAVQTSNSLLERCLCVYSFLSSTLIHPA